MLRGAREQCWPDFPVGRGAGVASRNPQGGCKAKMHHFQGVSNYSLLQHLCTWGRSRSLRPTASFRGSSLSRSLGGSIAQAGVEG